MWNQFGIGIAPYLASCSQNGVLRMVICSADRRPTRAERGEASGAAARLPCRKIPHPPRERATRRLGHEVGRIRAYSIQAPPGQAPRFRSASGIMAEVGSWVFVSSSMAMDSTANTHQKALGGGE